MSYRDSYGCLEDLDSFSNDCLELMNKFEDIKAWRQLQELILSNPETRKAVELRIMQRLSVDTVSRLAHARIRWYPNIVFGEDNHLGVGLCLSYPSEPRLAQSPLCRDEFLKICQQESGITQVVITVAAGYTLSCTYAEGYWRMEVVSR